jgi:hypothetical protein
VRHPTHRPRRPQAVDGRTGLHQPKQNTVRPIEDLKFDNVHMPEFFRGQRVPRAIGSSWLAEWQARLTGQGQAGDY